MFQRLCAIVFAAVAAGSTAHASVTTVFTDRAAWREAAIERHGLTELSGDLFEDFDAIASDLNYGGSPSLVVGFLTLSTNVPNSPASATFIVDASPFVFPEIVPVNVTAFAVAGVTPGVGTLLAFADVVAFGFEYGPPTDGGLLNLRTSPTALPVATVQTDGGFVGLIADAPGETFNRLEFVGTNAQAFAAIDDVEAFTPVPLPPALWLLGSCLALIAGRRTQKAR